MARRDDREYRLYLREEQRRQPGCPARKALPIQPRQATSPDRSTSPLFDGRPVPRSIAPFDASPGFALHMMFPSKQQRASALNVRARRLDSKSGHAGRSIRVLMVVLTSSVFVLSGPLGCHRTGGAPDEDSRKPLPAPSLLSKALAIKPAYATAALPDDPDDPAIWVHPTDPSRSLIIGTMKEITVEMAAV